MKYTILGKDDSIVYIESEDILISDSQSALDLMMTVNYETGCSRIAMDKSSIYEEFFRLSSGIAGDFSKYTSKPLHDFIYECNKGNDIFFVGSLEQAVEKLSLAH